MNKQIRVFDRYMDKTHLTITEEEVLFHSEQLGVLDWSRDLVRTDKGYFVREQKNVENANVNYYHISQTVAEQILQNEDKREIYNLLKENTSYQALK
ncbi:hypothetical protein [Aneurinibacillus aneurinilyticus]|jgi:hypothetical protein|uniref:Uncharacterized protein n=2 Tax=Aneurinibacillus aneurinilyticus TaxID=1391 RepID=A0A848CWY2_ANEAE|nr:hypothetical protein [Aneurinibacillus aneurinilyticus]ERI10945.1 hypothetical protein HMPREF0083_00945 [Aneurinibacillus aneurinilyticus ATCC 12856]MCI1694424.1 hypothetical protein [Aneurinibacillus aneurinilyticus]MED0669072.1 hypothetical protein [Aneurinibacillus aneurinilyticus]MED0709162.1 hypothetical protein [Aneurinibacillus aneurinilyticus]MED0724150.1 hypothetical protein [Aneurinibacillus aneurinilyticus]